MEVFLLYSQLFDRFIWRLVVATIQKDTQLLAS